jgi:hypothetical protein
VKEQRAHSRVSGQIIASVEVQAAPGGETMAGGPLECETRDISLTGMCFYTPAPLPAGTKLLVRIELGTPKRLFNLLGKVIWSIDNEDGKAAYRTGINLVQLPGDSAAWHNAVIQTLMG